MTNKESNYKTIMNSTLPKQLADKHWAFLQKWLEMIFKDGFLHGYKHGCEEVKGLAPKQEGMR